MMKNILRIISLLLVAVVLATALSGCKEEEHDATSLSFKDAAGYDYLKKLGDVFNYFFLSGDMFRFSDHSPYLWPEHASSLQRVKDIVKEGRDLITEYYNSDYRIRTVSVRLLEKHAHYAELLAEALIPKVLGDDSAADVLIEKMKNEFGAEEISIERYYDHACVFQALFKIFTARTRSSAPVIE